MKWIKSYMTLNSDHLDLIVSKMNSLCLDMSGSLRSENKQDSIKKAHNIIEFSRHIIRTMEQFIYETQKSENDGE